MRQTHVGSSSLSDLVQRSGGLSGLAALATRAIAVSAAERGAGCIVLARSIRGALDFRLDERRVR
jgi:hypothetical protein